MTKEEAAKYLRNQGYEAEPRDGSVVVLVPESEIASMQAGKTMRKIRKMLAGIGYTASTGVKVKREAEHE